MSEAEEGGKALAGWIERPALAKQLGVSIDTLQRWEHQRKGPPVTRLGRKVLYRIESFHEWLAAQERQNRPPPRPASRARNKA
jgi:phage terminase Nu1 subunit (DNA packaging protein)